MEKWEEVSKAKQSALLASIPTEWIIPRDKFPPESQLDVSDFPKNSGWFAAEELEICATPATTILEKIARKLWTSEKVTRAFCKRAAAAHQLTNCLSETLFDDALKTAKFLDDHLNQTGETVGPLHGLPVSLKDNFCIPGKDATVGFCSWVNDPATSTSVLVDILVAAGAVPYVKTNVPTAMMIAETVNNCQGRTVNPLNRNLTSGGSSGGESALIVFGGSPLGVGTDIGGSLRIPAACTGIFTLRPSFGRFPTYGAKSGLAGQEAVKSVNGPMSRDLASLALYAKAVIGSSPWLKDPNMLPIPWRQIKLTSKLKIAVLWHDGYVMPTPPVSRALKETADKLRNDGHEVFDWEPTLHRELMLMLFRMFTADGAKTIKNALGAINEPVRPEMLAYEKSTELGVYDMWQLQKKRTELCKFYMDRWNSCEGLDAILAPTTPYSSVKNGLFRHVGYTGVFNILDYSCVSFPCGVTADENLDQRRQNYDPLSEEDFNVNKDYDPAAVHGMPVSLQLVARKLEEEKVLAMTKIVLDSP